MSKSRRKNDGRVGITPDIATRLIKSGHVVTVEAGAGAAAGFTDDNYTAVGAEIGDPFDTDLVVTNHPPSGDVIAELNPNLAILGLLEPLDDPKNIAAVATTGATAIAFETLPRITRAQSMDALSSQATLAGYQAVIEGAVLLPKLLPMMTTAAGTVRPAKVIVLGAGVAGLQAIATAKRLGAVVHAYDVRAAAAEQVESLGAKFIELDLESQDETQSGGYARELAEDDQARQLAALGEHVATADLVITTAAIPGRIAPLLVTESMVKAMRPGSVIVDGAAATGGNCELTQADETVLVHGVTIIGPTNLAARLATNASQMLARNAFELITHLSDEDANLSLDPQDEISAGVVVASGGSVTNARVRDLLENS